MGSQPIAERREAGRDTRSEALSVMDSLRRIVRYLRLASRAAEVDSGTSAAQMFVLQRLSEAPASSLGELATRTMTDASSVSVVVRRLVERGLVTRTPSPTDSRRVNIALSAKGRAAIAKAPELPQVRILSAVEAMPDAERRQVAQALALLVTAIGADDVAPRMFFEDETPKRASAGAKRTSAGAKRARMLGVGARSKEKTRVEG